MSDKGLVLDNKQHELQLGASFNKHSKVGYHSIRCKFTGCQIPFQSQHSRSHTAHRAKCLLRSLETLKVTLLNLEL